jgi:pyridoxine kinase
MAFRSFMLNWAFFTAKASMTNRQPPPAGNPTNVLAISSLPANGNAGLKMLMSVLGTKLIPVPSLVLSGIGSIAGFKKFPVPFAELLGSSLELAHQRGEKLLLYVGYLMDAQQIEVIREQVEKYRDMIGTILVDPVCGDHGRAYVPMPIIEQWPRLLEVADLAFPNLTEVYLLGGNQAPFDQAYAEEYLLKFRERFPALRFVVTSLEQGGNRIVNRFFNDQDIFQSASQMIPVRYGGTGDAFVAYYVRFRYFEAYSEAQALNMATTKLETAISASFARGDADLQL